MKKRIKDLTYEEAKTICFESASCSKCPLNFNKKAECIPCYLRKLECDEYTKDYKLNKKVEIDE